MSKMSDYLIARKAEETAHEHVNELKPPPIRFGRVLIETTLSGGLCIGLDGDSARSFSIRPEDMPALIQWMLITWGARSPGPQPGEKPVIDLDDKTDPADSDLILKMMLEGKPMRLGVGVVFLDTEDGSQMLTGAITGLAFDSEERSVSVDLRAVESRRYPPFPTPHLNVKLKKLPR